MNNKKKFISTIIILLIAFFTVYYNDINNGLTNIEQTINKNGTTSVINTNDYKLKVYFIDVGQADSILIDDDNKYMLIDAGNNADGPKLVSYFKELGITKFEAIVGTHPHEDHIGGMDDIIKNFDIEKVYMPEVITTTKTFEDVLDAIDSKKISFNVPNIGDITKLNNSSIEVLSTGNDEKNLNDSSIVLKLKYGTTSFLFMGDASSKIESTLLNKDIKSDVLKVGHHGSKYSSSLSFLKKVNPTYAVISVGEGNTYDHPHKEILDRLSNNDIKVYRTDLLGTVIFMSNGTLIKTANLHTNTNGE